MASTSYRVNSNSNLGIEDGDDQGILLKSASSTVFTFNLNSMQGNGSTPDPLDAIATAPATVTNHANIVRVNVPAGANYLDLFHEFTGTTPTTRPTIRAFGRFPRRLVDGVPGVNGPTWPSDIAPTVYATIDNTRDGCDWLPLLDENGAALVELGSATDPVAWQHSDGTRTSKRSIHSTIRLRGAAEVIVMIVTAAATPTTGVVAGTFGV